MRVTLRENVLEVKRAVRPFVGVRGVPLQEAAYEIHLTVERIQNKYNEHGEMDDMYSGNEAIKEEAFSVEGLEA